MIVSMKDIEKQKNVKETTFWTYYVNRNLAKYFTYIFCRLDFSPNAVTIMSFIVVLIGALFLILNAKTLNFYTVLFSYLIWNISYALDSSDGQVARITGRLSKFGDWLDHSLDPLNKFIVITSLFYVNFINTKEEFKNLSFIAYSIALGSVLILYNAMMYKNLLLGIKTPEDIKMSSLMVILFRVFRLFFNLMDYGLLFILTFFLLKTELFLITSFIYFGIYFLGFFVYLLVRYRKSLTQNDIPPS